MDTTKTIDDALLEIPENDGFRESLEYGYYETSFRYRSENGTDYELPMHIYYCCLPSMQTRKIHKKKILERIHLTPHKDAAKDQLSIKQELGLHHHIDVFVNPELFNDPEENKKIIIAINNARTSKYNGIIIKRREELPVNENENKYPVKVYAPPTETTT